MGEKMSKSTKKPKCPECRDNSNVIDIHFGYGTLQETEKGAFVLNGCVINPQTPNFHCENCNIQFGRRKRFLRS